MGRFYWGVLRFFRGFLFSSAAASSSLILSLFRFANSFASSRYFFLLVCVLFRVLLVSAIGLGSAFSVLLR